jgi:hypothetical protein
MFGEEYRLLSSSLCNFFQLPVISSIYDSIILLNNIFSNNFSLRSSLKVSSQVSHPYIKPGRIIVLYILNYILG